MTKTVSKKSPKPDSKALPPLLDKRKERKRLVSISREQEKIKQNRIKQINLTKVLSTIKK